MMDETIQGLSELQSNLEWLLRKDLLEELVNLLELLQKSYIHIYEERLETRSEDCALVLKAKELFEKLQKDNIISKINTIARLIEQYRGE